MARPIKTGLDYFPLNTNMNDAIELIEAKHGIIGFGIIVKLWQRIYRKGYYYNWTEKQQLLLSKDAGVDVSVVINVVSDAINWGLFNQKLYKKHQILTSKGIQERYLSATQKRVRVDIVQNYSLIDKQDWDKVELTQFPEEETAFLPEESTQRKGKYNKENNSTEKKESIQRIYKNWNACSHTITHRRKTTPMEQGITARLADGFTVEDICKAIQNYNTVIGGKKYWFNYDKWSLDEFLSRGEGKQVEKFLAGVQTYQKPSDDKEMTAKQRQQIEEAKDKYGL